MAGINKRLFTAQCLGALRRGLEEDPEWSEVCGRCGCDRAAHGIGDNSETCPTSLNEFGAPMMEIPEEPDKLKLYKRSDAMTTAYRSYLRMKGIQFEWQTRQAAVEIPDNPRDR